MHTQVCESGPTPERRGTIDAAKALMGYLIMGFFFVAAAPMAAQAAKPVDSAGVPFGNGFPSGAHFNLNMIGKKANFTCPAPEYDVDTGAQLYGNVIFIPREPGTDPINILVESGKKGPKNAVTTDTLAVVDWCSESFADFGEVSGDPAVFQLPANDAGYAVYARITGKPGDGGEPSTAFTTSLYYVEDEAGNDLILLGLVDKDGTATFSSDGETVTRTKTSSKGKGVRKATNITDLFTWSGEVCYLQEDTDAYCLAEDGTDTCTALDLCCIDSDADGIYDRCDLLADVGELVDDGLGGTTLECTATDGDGFAYTFVEAQCKVFENEWVFNIADFVGVLWGLDNKGSYVVQIRFYPL